MNMKQKKNRSIEIPLTSESFEEARIFIEKRLTDDNVGKELLTEAMLVFEALFHKILEKSAGISSDLKITYKSSLGEVLIKIGFEGEVFYVSDGKGIADDPEGQILKAYNDKIDSYYHSGYNNIQLTVRRRYVHSLLFCIAGMLLAALVFIPIHYYMSVENQLLLVEKYLLPLETIFANAALMIGAPVTFFSLLKHITDTYILSQRYSDTRRLQFTTIITSILVILAACGTGFLIFDSADLQSLLGITVNNPTASETFSELISTAVPTNIFSPFGAVSPFPLFILTIVFAYALCASGKYFGTLYKGVNICHTLFSKMLTLVMYTLPVFCFINCLENLLLAPFYLFGLSILNILFLILVSIIVLSIFYIIRLLLGGVKLGPFLKKLPPLLRENFRINSAIDAVPFNIRYCVKNYGMNRKQLEKSLPILAEVNLDGNAFLLMLFAMLILSIMKSGYPWHIVAACAIIVLFLSFGAPNQPGSILIGSLIIMQYLGFKDGMASLAICIEVFFGIFQNITNVTGSIVTVAINERKSSKCQQI